MFFDRMILNATNSSPKAAVRLVAKKSRSFRGKLCRCVTLCAWIGLSAVGCATAPGSGGWLGSLFSPADGTRTPQLELAWGKLLERDGNLTEARASYQSVLQADPGSVDATLGLARLDYLANRVEDAERGYLRAVQLAPKMPQSRNALGQFYAEQERWDEALESLNLAVQAAPNERVYHFHYAVALTKSGKLDEALAEFTQAVGAAEAHYNIGRILYDTGNIPAAEEQFVAAVMQNPKLEQAQLWLEEIREGRTTNAVLSQAPSNAPHHPAAPSAPHRTQPASASQPAAVPAAAIQPPSAIVPTAGGAAAQPKAVQSPEFQLPVIKGSQPPATAAQLEQMRNQSGR
jgi:tetratricopeptide (TPR) repeat protein